MTIFHVFVVLLGIGYSMSILGPAIGYVLGGPGRVPLARPPEAVSARRAEVGACRRAAHAELGGAEAAQARGVRYLGGLAFREGPFLRPLMLFYGNLLGLLTAENRPTSKNKGNVSIGWTHTRWLSKTKQNRLQKINK